MKLLPSQQYLQECFTYNPEIGLLYWNKRPPEHFKTEKEYKRWNSRYANKEAFNYLDAGYFRGTIDHKPYKAHRVIWKLLYGNDANVIDHIDGNTQNNRLVNLRSISYKENAKNSKLSKKNTTGISGVSWSNSNKAWRAYIGKSWVSHYCDFFEACCARKSMEIKLGYHPNHGRIRNE